MILISIESILLFIVVGALTTAITKNIYANILIEQFKGSAQFEEERSTPTKKFYRVPKEEDELEAFEEINDVVWPGKTGDILISLRSELTIPFVGDFVSFFAGGHAAFVLGDYRDKECNLSEHRTLESSGLTENNNQANIYDKKYWTTATPYQACIGVRVKLTEAERHLVLAEAMGLWKDPYNYTFIFNTNNSSYCSDLINKAYNKVGVNLNKDGFTTSIYDIVVSGETYIFYYHYFDNNGVQHVYYLG